MENQVVLKTKESDIQEFYVDILGGEITRHFPLNVEQAIKSFDIPQAMEVYEVKLKNTLFELCPYEAFEQDSLQHLCLHLNSAANAYNKAFVHKYWTGLRKKNGKETYFIKDKNNNLFELED